MSRHSVTRIAQATGLAAGGAATGFISYKTFQLNVQYAGIPLGLIVAVVGVLAALFLLAAAVYLLCTRRSFFEFNGYLMMTCYLAILLALCVAAFYVGALIIVVGLGSLSAEM